MSPFDDLLRQVPVGEIAQKLGVDNATADNAVRQALPTLLSGLNRNAQDPKGADSIASALSGRDTSLAEKEVHIDDVDTNDGEKIVNRIFGDKKNDVISALAGGQGGSQASNESLISKVMPMLAPIVMAYMAKQYMGSNSGSGGLGNILGSVLGGQQNQGGIGGMLGGVLGDALSGGGQTKQGGLGGMLGGLLGGGKS
ncbi:DUF937 domain-containing protein [Hoyosella rhizosphaerae]|uniref:DUF937 domain-containing protein n=1 Tax=Hoyosella rhizosphaerae TaxID=1755582 RepID=A0A916UJP8_9ACTN|nr:DUF937 domain-containing protein [Hoyosella rhizosphaerae]MBN4928225.1 DUF937 domain-containing protein [Hoyosella rhizosphaerae]GGC73370.1 hypothetical protein GCM10011410_28120 [Hoyosella rhizosphaerae]